MKQKITVQIQNVGNIDLELDDRSSPNTVKSFLENLPFSVRINLWGKEIYTEKSPVNVSSENAKPLVDLYDVAYWPTGKAICLFFGPTPIGKKGEIKPYSPVNIIGKIVNADKNLLSKIQDGMSATFKIS